jgi:hypothetical protein
VALAPAGHNKGGNMNNRVTVTIQESDRLQAILNLSDAVKQCALALTAVPQVNVTGCTFKGIGKGTGMNVDTTQTNVKTELHSEFEKKPGEPF